MKILILFLTLATPLWGNGYENYLSAHNAYATGDYERAVKLFEGLSQNNFPVLYNLGWSYLKKGQLYEALVAFKKASRYAYGADRIKSNTVYFQLQDQLGVGCAPLHPYVRYIQQFFWYLPTFFLQLFFLYCILFTFFLLYWWGKRFIVYLCLLNMISGFLVCVRYYEESYQCALVKDANTLLYTGPDEIYATIGAFPRGKELCVMKTDNSWYCIRADQKSGWIHANDLDLMP